MFRTLISGGVLLMLLLASPAGAQDVQFTGSARPEVAQGETFSLTYRVNGQAMNFSGPSFPDFQLISGPNPTQSSMIQSVNGRTTVSVSYVYTYLLQAVKEGTFEIQPASVTVENKVYKSNKVTVKVVRNPNGQPAQGYAGGRTQPGQAAGQVSDNDVFLKAYVTNANPYEGEGVIVTYKIFTKVPIAQISISKLSSFPGFWSQNLLKDNEKYNQYTQVIDGEQYIVAEFRKIALFPLKTGKQVIDPLEIECVAQIKRQTRSRTGDPFFDDFFNDSFFSSSYATVEKTLKSNPLVINVKPLPAEGKPADFNGSVGSFNFTSEIDKTHVKADDPVTLKCTVSGSGNIQLVDHLNVSFPPDFETYDPKITSNISTTAAGISGSQTFEYLMIPRKAGHFVIKPVNFSWFDVAKKKYVSASSPPYTIDVDKGAGTASSSVTYSGPGKEDIKYIGSDIRHIRSQPFLLERTGTFFFGSPGYFLYLLIPVVLFAAFLIFWKKQQERRSNTSLMKNLKATKIARKRLKKAHEYLTAGKQEEFYIEISQAFWGYLSDKFGIPQADLSMESVSAAFQKKEVPDETRKQFM
ncbi:MAG TPA: BatD family protein, partial [Bacteroidales bacterium]|nr:BatD family protein [Bacteroidales bacterium]